MPRRQDSPPGGGYVLTELGRLDLYSAEVCHCNPRLAGLLVACPDCGTVYGSIREGLRDTQVYRGKGD